MDQNATAVDFLSIREDFEQPTRGMYAVANVFLLKLLLLLVFIRVGAPHKIKKKLKILYYKLF